MSGSRDSPQSHGSVRMRDSQHPVLFLTFIVSVSPIFILCHRCLEYPVVLFSGLRHNLDVTVIYIEGK